jgi:hypothetical protein
MKALPELAVFKDLRTTMSSALLQLWMVTLLWGSPASEKMPTRCVGSLRPGGVLCFVHLFVGTTFTHE